MKVLIVGYGSIGKRHEEVLLTSLHVKEIHIVTQQDIQEKITFKTLQSVHELESYDYIIIASETYKHFEQLRYLEEKVSKTLIFCEKPLFETHKTLEILNNTVYVGYVLRFHPLMQKLKNLLKDEHVISANVYCGQYLPTWRQGTDYRASYSAKKAEGGGVLLDLSHEIDYVQWLCGCIKEVHSYQAKISNLEIDSDDMTTFIGKTEQNVIVTVSMDYISKLTRREVMVHTLENTYVLDVVRTTLIQKNKEGVEHRYTCESLERNAMFEAMHHSILAHESMACTYGEAQDVMKTIMMIQEQNR
ncbi:MAG: Gfo/Idh/MocA family oxidoreductase [Campylobacterales bacterium]|nr:Gfo/Idh/MocA family oxidoreductase [Campylobacterales bacterium]MBN2832940.1 Gfo/Idh/MocA family oxidoreductase [Campylobacterales bacterium]